MDSNLASGMFESSGHGAPVPWDSAVFQCRWPGTLGTGTIVELRVSLRSMQNTYWTIWYGRTQKQRARLTCTGHGYLQCACCCASCCASCLCVLPSEGTHIDRARLVARTAAKFVSRIWLESPYMLAQVYSKLPVPVGHAARTLRKDWKKANTIFPSAPDSSPSLVLVVCVNQEILDFSMWN